MLQFAVGFLIFLPTPSPPPLFCFFPFLSPLFVQCDGCLEDLHRGSWLGCGDCQPWERYFTLGPAGWIPGGGPRNHPSTQLPHCDAVVNAYMYIQFSFFCSSEKDYPPVARAGNDVVIVLPVDHVMLYGNGSTDDKVHVHQIIYK